MIEIGRRQRTNETMATRRENLSEHGTSQLAERSRRPRILRGLPASPRSGLSLAVELRSANVSVYVHTGELRRGSV